ncbi:Os12g0615150 [Oryza sativa Japonica Group]|uniref:Os12g0615150 protein n=1 Tax=Oryza sativa subsp. japonica TaxID=39947 RepID=A0A0P0YC68_ORYSJ|nr:hypothetical protein EE612_060937 [Oryza sativa]BAT18087.1 Os12g0615150 [Oryza sativa Japonica Group]
MFTYETLQTLIYEDETTVNCYIHGAHLQPFYSLENPQVGIHNLYHQTFFLSCICICSFLVCSDRPLFCMDIILHTWGPAYASHTHLCLKIPRTI